MSILISTLNHNLPELTDNLIDQIKRDADPSWEFMVVDNGSSGPKARYTTHTLETNAFFGGGFNVILDYFLNETKHEYLAMLNNDLIFHGYGFMKRAIFHLSSGASVYSPAIINASIEQCKWKQMWNWGTGNIREVEWIDFQAPFLDRKICEIIKQYPEELVYGWGLDFYTGIIGGQNGLKTIVDDGNTVCHLNSQTFKQNKINIGINEFCHNAQARMEQFFAQKYPKEFRALWLHAENYDGTQKII